MTDIHKYKLVRKAFGPSFSKSNLSLLEPIIRQKAETCFKKVGRRLRDGEVVDIKTWLHFMAADTVGALCFGHDFGMLDNETENKLVRACVDVLALAAVQSQIPLLKYISPLIASIPHPTIKWVFDSETVIFEYGAQALLDHKHELTGKDGSARPSLFSPVLNDLDNPNAKYKWDLKRLGIEAMMFIIAGTDTTGLVGAYLVWAIYRCPGVKQKLVAELESIGWTEGDRDDGVTDENLQKLPYLKAVLQEVLRLYATTQFGLPRVVPKGGRVLGQYFIPAGTECFVHAYTLHRDPNIFTDPHEFRPERWLNATKEMESAILTFGGGARGQHVGLAEIRLCTAMMLKYCGEARLADSCTDESMRVVGRIISTPKGGKLELTY
ncbi:hypothetical protein TWF481_000136 [Arthrobotrys musiformis]|uniref:Cytochrome P450 n=1 Tax=Arthrobotrys musiformis TaxID=47236 RepID=A0AAV9WLQ0_9PEZI